MCSLRAHLESTVSSEVMTEIESTTNEFLKRLIIAQAGETVDQGDDR